MRQKGYPFCFVLSVTIDQSHLINSLPLLKVSPNRLSFHHTDKWCEAHILCIENRILALKLTGNNNFILIKDVLILKTFPKKAVSLKSDKSYHNKRITNDRIIIVLLKTYFIEVE
jgi:hypothetical protein